MLGRILKLFLLLFGGFLIVLITSEILSGRAEDRYAGICREFWDR